MKVLVTSSDIAKRLGISESLVIQMVKRNLLPNPLPRNVVSEVSWFAQEIDRFLDERDESQ